MQPGDGLNGKLTNPGRYCPLRPHLTGAVHPGNQQIVPLRPPLTGAVHPGNQQVIAMKQSYTLKSKRPWITCDLAGAIASGTDTIK